MYRVDALPALIARLDVSAAKSTGLTVFESALQSIVASQQEKVRVSLPRVSAIANQVKQALLTKAEAINTDLSIVKKKRDAKIQIKQKAEKLIKQGFQASVSDFQSWLYLPKLLEYQSDIVVALQQGEFKTWETEKFQPIILQHQQAIVKWVHQACEFFDLPQPSDLLIPLPDEPEVFIPEQPIDLNQSSNASSTGLVTELSQFLVETIGSVVIGGATYLFGQDSNTQKPESSATDLNLVSVAYTEAATDYLIRFNTQAISALRQYQEIAEITFQVTEKPLQITHQHHYLQLIQTLLDNLNQELESVNASLAR